MSSHDGELRQTLAAEKRLLLSECQEFLGLVEWRRE
jgi:hypothetical protein